MAIPAYQDIGKAAKDLLYGGKTGTFQYDKRLSIATKSQDGASFNLNGAIAADKILGDLKTTYTLENGVTVSSVLKSDQKATFTTSIPYIVKGLSAQVMASVPNITTSGQLVVDYVIPHVNLKTSLGLTAQPVVDIQASIGLKHCVVGGDIALSTASQKVTQWSTAVGYFGGDFAASLGLVNSARALKATYAHRFHPLSNVGAEFIYQLQGQAESDVAIGYAQILQNGAITKFKLDSRGLLSLLYEQSIDSQTKLTLSSQIHTSGQKPAKFGVAVEVNN